MSSWKRVDCSVSDRMGWRGKKHFRYICDQNMFGLGLTVKLVPSARRSVMLKAGVEAEAHQQSPLLSYWPNVAGCLLPPLCNPPPSTSVDVQPPSIHP
jgi:hypothetical protein